MRKDAKGAGSLLTTVPAAIIAGTLIVGIAPNVVNRNACVDVMKWRTMTTREQIKQVLTDSHSTLWGRAFDLSQPASLEAAIDFVQEILGQLERTDSLETETQAFETSTQALPPPSPDDCYSYTPNPTSWYSPVCSCSWCRNVLRTANGYLGEATAKQISVDRLPGI